MNITDLARQGDILFLRVDTLPAGVRRQDVAAEYVLAHGEKTGHSHTLVAPARDAEFFKPGEAAELADSFLRLQTAAPVKHPEHGTVTLSPGIWIVRPQREYTPQEIIRVAD